LNQVNKIYFTKYIVTIA